MRIYFTRFIHNNYDNTFHSIHTMFRTPSETTYCKSYFNRFSFFYDNCWLLLGDFFAMIWKCVDSMSGESVSCCGLRDPGSGRLTAATIASHQAKSTGHSLKQNQAIIEVPI